MNSLKEQLIIKNGLKRSRKVYISSKMPNYQNSMIYKLCCNDPTINDCYIGSTINFKVRKSQHKSYCNNENRPSYNNYKYQFIREHGGFENWSMILIENFSCDTKLELHKRERYWLEKLGATLNKNIPSRTNKESSKIYRENHKEELNEKSKIYRENRKEEISEYLKIYHENHKEKRNEKKMEKITCECGSIHTRSGKSNHLKSKKHKAFLNI
jgi:hypothetical protein